MATELTMPQMGYDMQEGTVVRWLKDEGSNVELGEPVAEIETDKAVVEFESYAAGVLQTILVEEGATVPVGQTIALVGEEAVAPPPAPEPEAQAPVAEPEPAAEEEAHPAIPLGAADAPVDGVTDEPIPAPSVSAPVGRVFATPIARQMAAESGIDLADVQGTGPGGRIVKEDIVRFIESQVAAEPEPEIEPEVPVVVEAVIEPEAEEEAPVVVEVAPEPVVAAAPPVIVEPEPEPEPEVSVVVEAEVEKVAEEPEPVVEAEPEPEAAAAEPEPEADLIPLSRMRQQIARVTIRSKDEKPHFYVNTDVDMTEAMALRGRINDALADGGVRVTINDLIVAAGVRALKKFPKFNAYYEDGSIRMNDDINVGIAMALEEGLIMPAVVGAGEMSLAEIAQATKDLAARANQGILRPEEYSGGTFAVSNMGMMNVTSFVAIIQPPQTAVLAVGAVQKRAVVASDDSIIVRQMMTATLSADHRIVDGAEGAFFINEIKRLLENPLSVIL